MRRMFWMLLAGCGPATAGIPDGSASSLQTPSATGTPNDTDAPSGVVWVDAEGTVVEEVVELPEGIAYEDQDGFFWALDASGEGTAAFVPFPDAGYVQLDYVDPTCSEQWIAGKMLPPRYVMRGAGGERSWTAQDDARVEEFSSVYAVYGGDCQQFFDVFEGLPFDDVVEVQAPHAYWVPPLHAETL